MFTTSTATTRGSVLTMNLRKTLTAASGTTKTMLVPGWIPTNTRGTAKVSHPQPRCGYALAYCASRNSLIVHGGDVSIPPVGVGTYDMWELSLDSRQWHNRSLGTVSLTGEKVVQPMGRWGHSIAPLTCTDGGQTEKNGDRVTREVFVMFGGSDVQKQRLGDTWLLSLCTETGEDPAAIWTPVEAAEEGVPSARDLYSFTPIGGSKVVLIGGRPVNDSPMADAQVWLCEADGNSSVTWKQLKKEGTEEGGPKGISGHSACYLPRENAIVVYGGWFPLLFGKTKDTALWKFHLDSLQWEPLPDVFDQEEGYKGPVMPPVLSGHVASLSSTLKGTTSKDEDQSLLVSFGLSFSMETKQLSIHSSTWEYNFTRASWRHYNTRSEEGHEGVPKGNIDGRSVVTSDGRWLLFAGEDRDRVLTNKLHEWRF